ncbi:hypothetical protein [Catellatospora vulcania]|uniref:hypothetical protein n=1 Tax=Catellatospora vulcania TaxID=1460450 RepID=UPI0012D42A56|nr:hypothetical protein [Catellatospora vulcania]
MGDLFTQNKPTVYSDTAWIGYYNGESGLADGFAQAGDAVFEAWRATYRPNDKLLLPMVYNYRHAIELALKVAIRTASERLRFAGQDDPELQPEAIEAAFKKTYKHRVEPLGKRLVELLKWLQLGDLPEQTTKILARLHNLDPYGEAFRYEGNLRTSATTVDVPRLAALFRDTFDLIHGGVLTELDVFEDYQIDMLENFGGVPRLPKPGVADEEDLALDT